MNCGNIAKKYFLPTFTFAQHLYSLINECIQTTISVSQLILFFCVARSGARDMESSDVHTGSARQDGCRDVAEIGNLGKTYKHKQNNLLTNERKFLWQQHIQKPTPPL